MYAKVENGQVVAVGLPQSEYLSDGRFVAGYNHLDADTLKAEGWLPLEMEPPAYDPETQELQNSGYDIQADKIVVLYTVQPKPEPPVKTPTFEERLAALELMELERMFA